MVLQMFLLIAAALLANVRAVEVEPLALHKDFRIDACPKDLKCAEPPSFRDEPVYELAPSVKTVARIHIENKVHPVKATTYLAKVETTVIEKKGLCEKLVPTTIRTRPTVTVWVDETTTSHFYRISGTETSYLTTTHRVVETTACFKEIGRHTPQIAPLNINPKDSPFGASAHQGGLKEDILKGVEKELKDKAITAAFPEAAAAKEAAEGIQKVLNEKTDKKK